MIEFVDRQAADPLRILCGRESIDALRAARLSPLVDAISGDESLFTRGGKLVLGRLAEKLKCDRRRVRKLLSDARRTLSAA